MKLDNVTLFGGILIATFERDQFSPPTLLQEIVVNRKRQLRGAW